MGQCRRLNENICKVLEFKGNRKEQMKEDGGSTSRTEYEIIRKGNDFVNIKIKLDNKGK